MGALDQLLHSAQQKPSAAQVRERNRYLVTRVQHLGINNLLKEASQAVAQRIGASELEEQPAQA